MQTNNSLKKIQLPNGETYAYLEAGNPSTSKTLLLLHSFTSSSVLFVPHLPKLTEKFHIIAPDLRGHGDSSYNKPVTTIEDLVEDIKQFVEAINLRKFSILGWSISGGIALKFAAKYPELTEKVILYASIGVQGVPTNKRNELGAPLESRAETIEEIAQSPGVKAMAEAIEKQDREAAKLMITSLFFTGRKQADAEFMERFIDLFLKCKTAVDFHVAMNKFNISNEDNNVAKGTGEIGKIKSPVLILHGEKDGLPKSEAEKTKKLLGDLAELKLFEDAGHILLEDYPEEAITTIKEFLLRTGK